MADLIITLLAAGYVSCIAGDIGKVVKDDGVALTALLGYDNTLRKWWISSDAIVVTGSVMTITAGTGAGTSTITGPDSGYCEHEDIKSRLIIASTDASYDTQIISAGIEASEYIDEKLRPYISPNLQSLVLKLADYVNCGTDEIGMTVRDDDVEIGTLEEYNNTTRTWVIRCKSTVAKILANSVVAVWGGTGYGVANADTAAPTEDDEPFIFLQVPLTANAAKIPDEIANICADLGAGIFKRRHQPQDMDAGWWAQGIRKLDEFIKGNFFKGTINFV